MEKEKANETESAKKIQSRKFIVWLTWLVITLSTLVFGMVLKGDVSESMKSLLEKVIEHFFTISCAYIALNVTQKLGFAISDIFKEGEK